MSPPASLPCGLRKPGLASCSKTGARLWGSSWCLGIRRQRGQDLRAGCPEAEKRGWLCAGEGRLRKLRPESRGVHTWSLLLGPGPQEGRCRLRAVCAPGFGPCSSPDPGTYAESLACRPALGNGRPLATSFCEVGKLDPSLGGGKATVSQVLCSPGPPRPTLFPLRGLWLVELWVWDPNLPPLSR